MSTDSPPNHCPSASSCGLDLAALESFLASIDREWPSEKRFERLLPQCSKNNARTIIDTNISDVGTITQRLLARLEQATVRLRSRRNNEASINSLPPAILNRIFDKAGEGGHDHQSIVRISWTCAIWRDVCLGSPSLWCRIDLTNISPRLAKLFSTRRQGIPLYISAIDRGSHTKYVSRQKDFETFCIDHIGAVRELRLALPIPPTWFSSQKLDATLLETLSLHFARPPLTHLQGGLPENRIIQDVLDTSPRLQHLSFDGILLPSVSGVFDHLRTLKINLPTIVPGTLDIFSILRRSSSLEVLSIAIPTQNNITDSALGGVELIPLTHLQQLTLKLPSLDIFRILSAISTPLSLCLTLKGTNPSDIGVSDVLPLDPRCLPCLEVTEKLCINREDRQIKMYRRSSGILEKELFLDCSTPSSSCFTFASIVHLLSIVRTVKEFDFDDIANQTEKLSARDLVTLLKLISDVRLLRLRACSIGVWPLFVVYAQYAKSRLGRTLQALYLEDMALDANTLVSVCASLTPHIGSILVSRCTFSEPEDNVIGILDAVKGVDFQMIEPQFITSQPIIDAIAVSTAESNRVVETIDVAGDTSQKAAPSSFVRPALWTSTGTDMSLVVSGWGDDGHSVRVPEVGGKSEQINNKKTKRGKR